MYKKDLSHIVLNKPPEEWNYTTPTNPRGKTIIPRRDRSKHGNYIKDKLQEAWRESELNFKNRNAVSLPVFDGIYIEFKSLTGYDLVTKSLEDLRQGIKLLNVHTYTENGQKLTKATVFIPKDKYSTFIKKVDNYLNEEKDNIKSGKPSNANLINSIDDIKLAVLKSFWVDDEKLIPKENQFEWCEVWLCSRDNEEVEKDFYNLCSILGIEYRYNEILKFPERKVVLVKADNKLLTEIISASSNIAEFRLAKETASFWIKLNNKEQSEWVKNLLGRLSVNKDSLISICVVDTGVNNGHVLLKPVIDDSDCFTVNAEWGTNDENGHGTLMCGVVSYGDLQECLESSKPINIMHNIESVKLLPKPGNDNKKHLYGALTEQGIYYAETDFPERNRVICMAITSDTCSNGKPSSWSGAIDKLTSGMEDNNQRLFVVSAGNILDPEEWALYPDSNITCCIQDPAQSWNALTVGAFTNKDVITDNKFTGYEILAKRGELSPFSRTSLSWENNIWPIKPDVVFEGGNLAKDNNGFIGDLEDLALLTLSNEPTKRQFDLINATSAATAQAAWFASQLKLKYPNLWPETIRALVVHSAEWTESIINQFYDRQKTAKSNYKNLLRICGYGVPNLDKAMYSASNNLTLLCENYIQPYCKDGSTYKTKDMHILELPWPKDVLLNLPSDAIIKLKVTLSYFVEPGPGEIGWKDRYRYQSHALRFALNLSSDTKDDFIKRLNKAAREEDEEVNSISDTRWKLGPNNRNLGSIHSDVWEGPASEIASCNLIGIYPVIGWWRERQHLGCWNKNTRYSLILSLETPKTDIDLYTPVEIALKTLIDLKST